MTYKLLSIFPLAALTLGACTLEAKLLGEPNYDSSSESDPEDSADATSSSQGAGSNTDASSSSAGSGPEATSSSSSAGPEQTSSTTLGPDATSSSSSAGPEQTSSTTFGPDATSSSSSAGPEQTSSTTLGPDATSSSSTTLGPDATSSSSTTLGPDATSSSSSTGFDTDQTSTSTSSGGETTGDPACAEPPLQAPGVERSCEVDADCIVVLHQTDCCGSVDAYGIHAQSKQAYDVAESPCMFEPFCDCAPEPTDAEDGEATADNDEIVAVCVDNECRSAVP